MWHGTWCASEGALPADKEFSSSANTFSLTINEPIGMIMLMDDGDCDGEFIGGSYKLDNGDGLSDYQDERHVFHLLELREPDDPKPCCIVGACGMTEFGRFVSLGRMTMGTDGPMLTLARRYVSDDDPRAKLSAKEVLALVFSNVAKKELIEERFDEAPWEALPWKVESM